MANFLKEAILRPDGDGNLTVIYLVRHGITQSGIDGRHIGQKADEDLTDEGMRQARTLADMLRLQGIAAIYSSPLKRAVSTARIIRDEMVRYNPSLPQVFQVDRFTELDIGVFEGSTDSEIASNFPVVLEQRTKDKWGFGIPRDPRDNGRGESYSDLVARVKGPVDDIIRRHAFDSVCIVGHQGVNRAILKCLLGDQFPNERVPYILISHEGFYRAEQEGDAFRMTKVTPGLQTTNEERFTF
ncbi:TPA: histidine phosphatase family protein [Candidatus Woesearchaeota archaeon]|nr:histidine phosphatase family protein [Candidatus Woesearchaeota archaeon]